MEERKYTFYDRYQKVKYANITVEELEVLNISYNKEHYMFDQQHQRNNTVLFCGLESENGCATDFIADSGRDIASDITTEIFFKELFSDLTEKEKKIVSDYFIMGKQVKETAEELGISTRQVSRDKNSALAKMLKREHTSSNLLEMSGSLFVCIMIYFYCDKKSTYKTHRRKMYTYDNIW